MFLSRCLLAQVTIAMILWDGVSKQLLRYCQVVVRRFLVLICLRTLFQNVEVKFNI